VVFVSATKGPVPPPPRPSGSGSGRNRQSQPGNPRLDDDGVIMVDDDNDEMSMMKLMGFSDFNTTKGKHVPGNDTYAANIVQKRKYRQYMNRRGGFNRPLDFVA
jgi:U4/U6.U5 tri-snRNP-associated protein 3